MPPMPNAKPSPTVMPPPTAAPGADLLLFVARRALLRAEGADEQDGTDRDRDSRRLRPSRRPRPAWCRGCARRPSGARTRGRRPCRRSGWGSRRGGFRRYGTGPRRRRASLTARRACRRTRRGGGSHQPVLLLTLGAGDAGCGRELAVHAMDGGGTAATESEQDKGTNTAHASRRYHAGPAESCASLRCFQTVY